jgi:hypothetical protein
MPRKRRHIVACVLWVVASLLVWAASLSSLVALVLIPARPWLRRSGWMEVVGNTYNVIALSGLILIPSVVAYLAVRARLPWTGGRASNRRGFPLERPQGAA